MSVGEQVHGQRSALTAYSVDEVASCHQSPVVPLRFNAIATVAIRLCFTFQDHPFGFVAKPTENTDGSLNMWIWECIIPGPKDTIWEPGQYRLKMMFREDYPATAPKCRYLYILRLVRCRSKLWTEALDTG